MVRDENVIMQVNQYMVDRKELLYIELIASFICLFCNIYFAFRFSTISTFSPNLRIVMVVFQLFTATISFLHPILHFIPRGWYSLENRIGASIYYTVQFYIHVCLFIMCAKYATFGFERRIAIKNRVNYEFQDGKNVKKLLVIVISLLSLVLLIKSLLIFYFDKEVNMQKRLEKSILIDKCPPVLILLHAFGAVSWFYGLYEFTHLSTQIRKHWYSGKTLSESYQIRQSGAFVKVIKPIVIAFMILFISNSTIMSMAMYIYYIKDYDVDSPIFVTLMNIEYTGVAFYNLFGTIYMLLYFKQMRRILFQDVAIVFFIDLRSKQVHSYGINWSKETEDHFKYLKDYWNRLPNQQKS